MNLINMSKETMKFTNQPQGKEKKIVKSVNQFLEKNSKFIDQSWEKKSWNSSIYHRGKKIVKFANQSWNLSINHRKKIVKFVNWSWENITKLSICLLRNCHMYECSTLIFSLFHIVLWLHFLTWSLF